MVGILFIICILMLSQAGTLVRFADASSLAICFWRLALATVALLPFTLRRTARAQLRSLSAYHYRQLALSGLLMFAHFYFFFRSVQDTTVADATILFSLNPVSTAVTAYVLLGHKINTRIAIACLLGFSGVAVLFFETSLISSNIGHARLLGDVYGLLSAICFSGYIVTGKRVRTQLSNLLYAALVYGQTAVWAAILMWGRGETFTHFSVATWWAFAALAIFPTLLGHAIFTYCLNSLDINFMSCMTLAEPLLAALTARWFFQEPMSNWSAFAFLLTCGSIVALYWNSIADRLNRRARSIHVE